MVLHIFSAHNHFQTALNDYKIPACTYKLYSCFLAPKSNSSKLLFQLFMTRFPSSLVFLCQTAWLFNFPEDVSRGQMIGGVWRFNLLLKESFIICNVLCRFRVTLFVILEYITKLLALLLKKVSPCKVKNNKCNNKVNIYPEASWLIYTMCTLSVLNDIMFFYHNCCSVWAVTFKVKPVLVKGTHFMQKVFWTIKLRLRESTAS